MTTTTQTPSCTSPNPSPVALPLPSVFWTRWWARWVLPLIVFVNLSPHWTKSIWNQWIYVRCLRQSSPAIKGWRGAGWVLNRPQYWTLQDTLCKWRTSHSFVVLANRPHSYTWAGKRSSSTALLLLIALRVTLSCCDGFIASLSLWVRGSRAMQSCAQSRTGVSCSLWLWSGVSVANGQCSSIMMLHRPVRESTERSCHSSHTAAWHCPSAGGAKGAVSTDAPTDALTHVWVWEKEFHHHKLWWVKQTGLWIKNKYKLQRQNWGNWMFLCYFACDWLIDWLSWFICCFLFQPDLLQWQHPHADSDTGHRRRHPRTGGAPGGGERPAWRLQHATDTGQQGQVQGGSAGPLRRTVCRLGGRFLYLQRVENVVGDHTVFFYNTCLQREPK